MGSIHGLGRSPGEGSGNPLQYSCLENPMDRGACWATVHGVAKSRTQLKQLSTHAGRKSLYALHSLRGRCSGDPVTCELLVPNSASSSALCEFWGSGVPLPRASVEARGDG